MGDKLAKSKNLCCHLVVFTRYSLLNGWSLHASVPLLMYFFLILSHYLTLLVHVVIECPPIDETTVATNLLRKINVHLNGVAVTTLIFG